MIFCLSRIASCIKPSQEYLNHHRKAQSTVHCESNVIDFELVPGSVKNSIKLLFSHHVGR